MVRMSASESRANLSDAINRVAYGGERVVLVRRDKAVAVLVSVEDAAFLEELGDRLDLKAARKALKERGTLSLEELKGGLGS